MPGETGCPTEPRQTPCLAKLDRLGWNVWFSFECFGARFGVRSNDPELLEQIRKRLPPGSRNDPGRKIVDVLISARRAPRPSRPGLRGFHLLYLSIRRVERTVDLEQILEAFDQHIHLLVAAFARRHAFVHAGCVAWRGRAILIPGRTLAGKSTLVHALVEAGAEYLSDEYAIVDARGRVRAYPKLLSLRASEGRSARLLAPERARDCASPAVPVGLVAAVRFTKTGRGRWRPLTPAEAVLELLGNTVSVRRNPALAMRLIPLALRQSRAVKGTRGEAAGVAMRLLELADAGGALAAGHAKKQRR